MLYPLSSLLSKSRHKRRITVLSDSKNYCHLPCKIFLFLYFDSLLAFTPVSATSMQKLCKTSKYIIQNHTFTCGSLQAITTVRPKSCILLWGGAMTFNQSPVMWGSTVFPQQQPLLNTKQAAITIKVNFSFLVLPGNMNRYSLDAILAVMAVVWVALSWKWCQVRDLSWETQAH